MSRPSTIAEIADRASVSVQRFDACVREFLDAWQTMSPTRRTDALQSEPVTLNPVCDAYLAALAEHLALTDRLEIPAWTDRPHRFLDVPFFSGGLEFLKATLLVESPLAFRRRLVFISADGLFRPRRDASSEEASPHVRA